MLQEIAEPSLEAFVSNAGIIDVELASAVTVESFNRTISANLLAVMLLVHELRKKIQKSRNNNYLFSFR